jgi:hypothetical protein
MHPGYFVLRAHRLVATARTAVTLERDLRSTSVYDARATGAPAITG